MPGINNLLGEASLEEEAGIVETTPNEAADPPQIVERKVPADIRRSGGFSRRV